MISFSSKKNGNPKKISKIFQANQKINRALALQITNFSEVEVQPVNNLEFNLFFIACVCRINHVLILYCTHFGCFIITFQKVLIFLNHFDKCSANTLIMFLSHEK